MLAGGTEDKEHAMSQNLDVSPAAIGIDIGKNSFHIVGQNKGGAIVLRCARIDLQTDTAKIGKKTLRASSQRRRPRKIAARAGLLS